VLKGFGVSFSLNPGLIATGINKDSTPNLFLSLINYVAIPLSSKTASQGAATQVYAATAPELSNVGGVYLDDCQIVKAERHADNMESADRLWQMSLDSVESWLH